ncbi:MAG TPA: hypothetical protein VM582_05490, partial [Candidatus Thermoplasmatota archaeon]|nr:hypothetical protein [Candidatus Thermoplasmatota archaeon]
GCAGAHTFESVSGLVKFRVSDISNGVYSFTVDVRAPNDCGAARDASAGSPVTLGAPFTCAGSHLLPEDIEDSYAFNVTTTRVVRATVTSTAAGARACIVDPAGADVACGPAGAARTWLASPGTWRVRVESDTSAEIRAYTLSLTLPAQNDCGSGRDASATAPVALVVPFACDGGHLHPGDVEDTYAFNVTGSRVLRASVVSSAPGARACLVQPDGADAVCAPAGSPHTWLASPGAWRLRVESDSGADLRAYSVALVELPPMDCGAARDASADAPVHLMGAVACAGGMLHPDDILDAYTFDVGAATNLSLNLTSAVDGIALCLHAPDGRASCRGPGAPSQHALVPGRWRVEVAAPTGPDARSYGFGLQFPGGAPDCGTGGDLPSAGAVAFDLPLSCWGVLGGADTADSWSVVANAGASLDVEVTPMPGFLLQACVREPLGAETCTASPGPGLPARLARTLTQNGTHAVRVVGDGAYGGYAIAIAGAAEPDGCGGAGRDAGVGADAIWLNETLLSCTGGVARSTDAADEYIIPQTRRGTMRVVVTPHDPMRTSGLMLCPGSGVGGSSCAQYPFSAPFTSYEIPASERDWRLGIMATGSSRHGYTIELIRVPSPV